MELRKMAESRELDTRKVDLRQMPGRTMRGRNGSVGSAWKMPHWEPDPRYRTASGFRSCHDQAAKGFPSNWLQGLTKAQRKKWDSYSPNQKRKILEQAERTAARRMRYQPGQTYKRQAVKQNSRDISRYRLLETKRQAVHGKRTYRSERIYTERYAPIPDRHSDGSGMIQHKTPEGNKIRKIRLQAASKRLSAVGHSAVPRLADIAEHKGQPLNLAEHRLPVGNERRKEDTEGSKQQTASVRPQEGRKALPYEVWQAASGGYREVRRRKRKRRDKTRTEPVWQPYADASGKSIKQWKKANTGSGNKEKKITISEVARILDKEQSKDEQIRQMQKTGQIEMSMAELEQRTGAAVVRPFALPVQIRLERIKEKIGRVMAKAAAVLAKYALIAGSFLFFLLVLLSLLSSLIGGIAGEEAANECSGLESGYELVEYAQQWIGVTKYIWGAGRSGATSWQSYADCSSFVHGVFAHFGYEIGWTTYAQETSGTLVSGGLSNALPGDIILFYSGSVSPGNSSHVGIYAGDGKMIHCSGGRANTSPATAGRGVCWGTPGGDGRPYVVRRILPEINYDAGNATSGHRTDPTSYTQSQLELIWAIVAQEDNGSYKGALAVISSAMNRADSSRWSYLGNTAMKQLTAPGQYCYSNDSYWQARLNGNVPSYVKQAVSDCLKKGIRNHSYTCFRSQKGSQTGANAVQIGGNWFFGD